MGDVRFNSKLTTGHFFVDHFVNTSSEESTRVSTLELFYSGNVICFLFFVVWAWPTRSEFPHRNADIKMPKGKLPRLYRVVLHCLTIIQLVPELIDVLLG